VFRFFFAYTDSAQKSGKARKTVMAETEKEVSVLGEQIEMPAPPMSLYKALIPSGCPVSTKALAGVSVVPDESDSEFAIFITTASDSPEDYMACKSTTSNFKVPMRVVQELHADLASFLETTQGEVTPFALPRRRFERRTLIRVAMPTTEELIAAMEFQVNVDEFVNEAWLFEENSEEGEEVDIYSIPAYFEQGDPGDPLRSFVYCQRLICMWRMLQDTEVRDTLQDEAIPHAASVHAAAITPLRLRFGILSFDRSDFLAAARKPKEQVNRQ
jgi:hypothetical protein